MSIPREGSRVTDEGYLVCSLPDWCRVGGSVYPFQIYAKQIHEVNSCTTVRLTSKRSYNKNSIIRCCFGDEGGVNLGVTSNTKESICRPKTWSETVFFEGANAVRHDDEWWMNNGNTWGKLFYIKDQKPRQMTPDAGGIQLAQLYVFGGSSVFFTRPLLAPRIGELGKIPGELGKIPGEVTKPGETTTPGPGRVFRFPDGKELPDGIPKGPNASPPDPFGPTKPPVPMQGQKPQLTPNDDQNTQPQTQPQTKPNPENTRTSKGCIPLLICFLAKEGLTSSTGGYGSVYRMEQEYRRQLLMQQEALNSKSAANCYKDKDDYDNYPGGSKAMRALADKAKEDFLLAIKKYDPTITDGIDSLYGGSAALLHKLDMYAGGKFYDFGWFGNSNVNSAIGSAWTHYGRGKALKEYCKEMAQKNCPVQVWLVYDCSNFV